MCTHKRLSTRRHTHVEPHTHREQEVTHLGRVGHIDRSEHIDMCMHKHLFLISLDTSLRRLLRRPREGHTSRPPGRRAPRPLTQSATHFYAVERSPKRTSAAGRAERGSAHQRPCAGDAAADRFVVALLEERSPPRVDAEARLVPPQTHSKARFSRTTFRPAWTQGREKSRWSCPRATVL